MERSDIELFLEHVEENLLPDDVPQEKKGQYTADDWTIEVCKNLLFDEDSPSSNYKRLMYKALQELKDDADYLFIGEVGRGLDIIISQMVKDWKWITCYDHNPIYEKYLNKYFYYDITFHPVSSSYFLDNIDMVKEKSIMIMNHSKVRQFEIMKENKNIVHLIFDGEILW
jgi:hypothetical protein